jgi:hypothetical protein
MSDLLWRNDQSLFQQALHEVAHAGQDTFVLVNSPPRTGSKFLYGVLIAAFGALSGFSFSASNQGVTNPGHTHGLSEKRLGLFAGEKREIQGLLVSDMRTRLETSKRIVVFTTLRPEASRIFSAFVVHKERQILCGSAADICEEFDRYQRANSLDRWSKDEVTGVFGAPRIGSEALAEPFAFENGYLIYVTVPLSQIESFLERYLFPLVSRSELDRRSEAFQLHYGLHNQNSSRSRGLSFAQRKAAYILGAGDLTPLSLQRSLHN